MKKSLIVSALLFAAMAFSASAQDSKKEQEYKYPFQEAKISYHNVTVYKVLDHKDAYLVMYAKGHGSVGSVSIPKKWYEKDESNHAKLAFRPLPKGMAPWMTVVTKEGSFNHVILTMPVSRMSASWGVADSNLVVSDKDKDSLEMVY
ncbi:MULTISPECIES: hypothetical protein [Treponema]|jgi:hypothetical protein|uniref:Uncharacterized protein n=1 Tax=Treponema saccharophilum DSM 2985 TaxID=907348 RepID=H7ENV5_9SPIR|nr:MULTISPECIES: hypothetical protein [Treponema]EIC00588.1 hypothetical protein TresaDRAFT_0061 [Treponema saccharophilum DSM 2985]MBQ5537942.1 hypothetical protein [Treponema sp.]BDC95676.1 hypothetical protein TRSA_07750 [Treponema saccharophilum]